VVGGEEVGVAGVWGAMCSLVVAYVWVGVGWGGGGGYVCMYA